MFILCLLLFFLLPITCYLDWEKGFWDPLVGGQLVERLLELLNDLLLEGLLGLGLQDQLFEGLLGLRVQDQLLEGLLRFESWRRASQSWKFKMLGFWQQVVTGRIEVDSPRGTIVEIPAKFALANCIGVPQLCGLAVLKMLVSCFDVNFL